MKRILVRHGDIKALTEILGVSDRTIRRALRGERDNALAHKIRKAARERGGVESERSN